jgi:hypothetical protein
MKKELEQLIFEGKLTDSIKLLNRTWTLQTNSVDDNREVAKKVNTDNDNVNLLNFKIDCVARSLVSIDDIVLESYKEKSEFVSKLPLVIVDKLFDTYNKLTKKLNESFNEEAAEELKN